MLSMKFVPSFSPPTFTVQARQSNQQECTKKPCLPIQLNLTIPNSYTHLFEPDECFDGWDKVKVRYDKKLCCFVVAEFSQVKLMKYAKQQTAIVKD